MQYKCNKTFFSTQGKMFKVGETISESLYRLLTFPEQRNFDSISNDPYKPVDDSPTSSSFDSFDTPSFDLGSSSDFSGGGGDFGGGGASGDW